jgi:hypothetical protein
VTISGFKNQSILNRRQRQKPSQPIFNFTDALILITAHVLLMFTIRTVRLLDISCCLSHGGRASEARLDKIAKNIEFLIIWIRHNLQASIASTHRHVHVQIVVWGTVQRLIYLKNGQSLDLLVSPLKNDRP